VNSPFRGGLKLPVFGSVVTWEQALIFVVAHSVVAWRGCWLAVVFEHRVVWLCGNS